MLTNNQIKIVHSAISKLGLKDFEYRDILSNFNVQSSKDLSYEQFKELMKIFERLGFKSLSPALSKGEGAKKNRKKYNDLNNRYNDRLEGQYATPKQLRLIETMWLTNENVKYKNIEALRKFVKRIVGIENMEWLMMNDVHKVVKAIKSLTTKSHTNEV